MGEYHLKCVVDTSLLIDIDVGDILAELFSSPYTFIAPNAIIAELQKPDGRQLLKMGLQQYEPLDEAFAEVLQLKTLYQKPSVNDLLALVSARMLDAPLLTNDGSLRKAAYCEGVTAHGTLWMLDRMVQLELLSYYKAAKALELMCEKGSRFPKEECEYRLKTWKHQ